MAWNDEDEARAAWEAEEAQADVEAEAAVEAQNEAVGYVQCVHGNVRAFCEQCEQEQQ